MTYKCNVLFVPGHRAPVVREATTSALSPLPSPRVHAHNRARSCVYAHAVANAYRIPGPDTEAASAFLLYYV